MTLCSRYQALAPRRKYSLDLLGQNQSRNAKMSSYIVKKIDLDTDLFRRSKLHPIFIRIAFQLISSHYTPCSRVNYLSIGECYEIQVKLEISNAGEVYFRFQLCSTSQSSLWFVFQRESERRIRVSYCNVQLPELEVRSDRLLGEQT